MSSPATSPFAILITHEDKPPQGGPEKSALTAQCLGGYEGFRRAGMAVRWWCYLCSKHNIQPLHWAPLPLGTACDLMQFGTPNKVVKPSVAPGSSTLPLHSMPQTFSTFGLSLVLISKPTSSRRCRKRPSSCSMAQHPAPWACWQI